MKRISCWIAVSVAVATLMAGCATTPPRQPEDLCQIFQEKDDWYQDARDASKRWGSPIPVLMAIMYQESAYQAKARPPRKRFLWVLPGLRKSSAYGYAQVTDPTWEEYLRDAAGWGASRSDFEDAVDFIGWYNARTRRRNGIALTDAYSLYLAYHEGHGGFRRGTYHKKAWLKRAASRVAKRAERYQYQLARCEKSLQRSWWPGF